MDYLQYKKHDCNIGNWVGRKVLNLIINGLPSIQTRFMNVLGNSIS